MSAALLVAAVVVDVVLGEPPNALHPVAWMGHVIGLATRAAPLRGAAAPFVYGAILALALPAGLAALSAVVLALLQPHPVMAFAVSLFLLKSTFSLRGLGAAARTVRDALAHGDLPRARHELRALCSRDARSLDGALVAAATIESVAENASDSFVAPLFYFALFGVPGAVFYRTVNTLDAMVGYRGRYEWLGKASARLDDALNLIPARITALLLLVAGALLGHDARRGWRVLARDGGRTSSPNAGRPMAAMAGLLGVQLEKPGCYALGDASGPIDAATIDQAWRITRIGAWLALAATIAVVELPPRHGPSGRLIAWMQEVWPCSRARS